MVNRLNPARVSRFPKSRASVKGDTCGLIPCQWKKHVYPSSKSLICQLVWEDRETLFTTNTIWLKVRPLFTLSHRGSDNSLLLMVFKWTLYELYWVMISTNQIAYLNAMQYFWRWQNRKPIFSRIKVTIDWSMKLALNTISNGELSNPLCDSVNRGLTLVRL